MSTLFVNTIKPDSGSQVLISSSLSVSEDVTVVGNLTLSGSINLGDADTDSVSFNSDISSSILPDADNTFDLGSTSKQWRHLHVSAISASGVISSSGTIIAQNIQVDKFEINKQVFSSITSSGGITASAYFGDGSNLTGIGISGSALDVINISSSGNISSSATGSFQHLVVSGDVSGNLSASGTGSFQGGIDCIFDGTITPATGSFGYISASGDISTSGNLYGRGLYLHQSDEIHSTGDLFINAEAPGTIEINEQENDVDFRITDSEGTSVFFSDASTQRIGIGINDENPQTTLHVSGTIMASGASLGIDAAGTTGSFGMVSASGDISSSGTGSFENLYVRNNSDLVGPITASGNISASGTIITSTLSEGDIEAGLTLTGNITASGIISSSLEITSNTLSTTHEGITTLTVDNEGNLSSSGDILINTGSFFHGDGRMLTNITTSAAVGGADTQVLFNDNGAVGGEAGIIYSTGSLTLSGHLVITGTTSSVSASRVSASAGFEADTLSTSSFGYISCSGDITCSGTGFFAGGINCISPGGDDVDGTGSFGYISCSGDISMSGTFAAGAISSSGTISASLLKGQSVQAQVGNNLGYRFNLNNDS